MLQEIRTYTPKYTCSSESEPSATVLDVLGHEAERAVHPQLLLNSTGADSAEHQPGEFEQHRGLAHDL